MSNNIPKLNRTLHRFNQGCRDYNRAIKAWKDHRISEYEHALGSAATETIGALEWALKVYLRSVCRGKVLPEDSPRLKQPNFDDLMKLMQKYASPPIEETTVNRLYDYRDLFRNPAEHHASVPPVQDLGEAIRTIRGIILDYLPVEEVQLETISELIARDVEIQRLKSEYLNMVRSRYEYMDLGGISPRVGNKVVRIRIEDLFIPPRAAEEEPLFEDVAEEAIEEIVELSEPNASVGSSLKSDELPLGRAWLGPGAAKVELARSLEKSKVVVLGDPGSGKTTIGKYIAYSLAVGTGGVVAEHLQHHIPVVVRAAEYAAQLRQSPDLSFYSYLTQRHTDKFGELFEWALETGLAMIIVDGLDEVPDAQGRVSTSRRIEQFVREFENNRFLVTSRIVGYRQSSLASDFVHATLSDWDEEEIQQFLLQWYRAIEVETGRDVSIDDLERRASGLWTAIDANPGIRKLAGNPLLLTIIALADWRGTRLPSRRVELYQIATETLIENWPLRQRNVTLDAEEILEILDPIAHYIVNSGKNNTITRYELRPLFEKQVCEVRGATAAEARVLSREMLRTIGEHTGFFIERGVDQSGQSVYGFLHLTFAEYLAARHLAEQWSSGLLALEKYAHDARWHEVLLLMAGHVGTWATAQATRLVNDILQLNSPYEEHLHRDLLLAAEMLGDNVRVRRDLQNTVVSRLISLALTTSHTVLWNAAESSIRSISQVWRLGELESSLQLAHGDDTVTRARKAMLLRITGEQSGDILPTLLEAEPHDAITRSYLQRGDSELHEAEYRRTEATYLLGRGFMNPFAIDSYTADKIRQTGIRIEEGLDVPREQADPFEESKEWYLVDMREIRALDAASLADYVREAPLFVYRAFSRIFAGTDSLLLLGREVLDRVLSEEEDEARLNLLDTLLTLLVVARAEHEEFVAEAGEAVRSLAHIDHEPKLRARVLRFVVFFVEDPAVQARELKRALSDPDSTVRLAAIENSTLGLWSLRGEALPEIRPELKQLLRDENSNVRVASARTLAASGDFDQSDIDLLLEALNSKRPETFMPQDRQQILEGLWLMRNWVRSLTELDAIDEQIVELIKEHDISHIYLDHLNNRSSVGSASRELGGRLAERLVELFDDTSSRVRTQSVRLWSYARSESQSSNVILPLLNDADTSVKIAAISAVRPTDLRDSQVYATVIHALQDGNHRVARRAAAALSGAQEPQLREGIANEVVSQLDKDPNAEAPFEVLWSLTGVVDEGFSDVPF